MIDLGTDAPRIGVFRALVLGDMLCAVPALRALRHGWPQAEITLIGLPWAAELAQRLPQVDRFIAFPGHAGLPESRADEAAWPQFMQAVRAQRFDLVLQMHGSGRITNPLVRSFGARHAGGFFEPAGEMLEPALSLPWPTDGHEIGRLLKLTRHLGLPAQGDHLDFPLHSTERLAAAAQWPGEYICIHPGAQLPSRRWPPERFAAVGDALAARGYEVLVTGTVGEADIADAVVKAMKAAATSLAGRTSLWALGALIERARLLVCNDTGVSHIASALRTPSVVVSLGADVTRWAPLDHHQHRVLWAPVECRPCSHVHCPIGHACALAIEPGPVIRAALTALEAQHAH